MSEIWTRSSIFAFISSSSTGELFAPSSRRQGSSNWANIPRTCWTKLFAVRRIPEICSRSKCSPIKKQLCSQSLFRFDEYPQTMFVKQMFAQLRTSYVRRFFLFIFFIYFFQVSNYVREANVRPVKNGPNGLTPGQTGTHDSKRKLEQWKFCPAVLINGQFSRSK